jgi:general secretion pathway protein F
MPVYIYEALNSKGEKVTGEIEGESLRRVQEKLRQEKLYPVKIREFQERKGGFHLRWFQRVSSRDLTLFTRQLSTLLSAGLPLVDALTATVEQAEEAPIKAVILSVRDKVNEGMAFHEALKNHPGVFNDLYVNMIRAGEMSGTLEIVVERLADFLEHQQELRNQVLSTMAYPLIMVCAMVGVVGVLFVYVIPKIVQVFEHTGQSLPLPTKILIFLATQLRTNGFFLLLGVFLLAFLFHNWKKTPRGKETWDRMVLRLPLFGVIIRYVLYSRFARTLATLLASGVTLTVSLEIVKAILGNVVFERAIDLVKQRVIEGASLSEPLKAQGLFPSSLVRMVHAGETSGDLEGMLAKVADLFDREVTLRIQIMMRLLEPIMIVILGGLVFFIMASILIPMFKINQIIR